MLESPSSGRASMVSSPAADAVTTRSRGRVQPGGSSFTRGSTWAMTMTSPMMPAESGASGPAPQAAMPAFEQ